MNKVLFITTRNIFTTCGELRLIKNRANALYKFWGIVTDYIAVNNRKRINESNEPLGIESKISAIVFDKNIVSNILGFFKLRKEIENQIKTGHYKCVILSGIGTIFFVRYIKKLNHKVKIIADIHGAYEDTLEFSKGNILKKIWFKILYYISRSGDLLSLSKVDALFVVSNSLEKYIKEKNPLIKNKKCYVVPCAIDDFSIKLEDIEKNRYYYRKKYGINNNELLFAYSGGISPWQCIEESIDLFRLIKNNVGTDCKMLILSHNINKISSLINSENDIITDKVSADEVESVICSADFAFLLRKNSITNNVAFPNKFLEYVKSGLTIVTTPYIFDIADLIKSNDLGVLYEFTESSRKNLYDYIKEKHDINLEKRTSLLKLTSFQSRLKEFVDDIFCGSI